MCSSRPMIQEKMNVLEQVGLSESNLSDNALNASFHSRVNYTHKHTQTLSCTITAYLAKPKMFLLSWTYSDFSRTLIRGASWRCFRGLSLRMTTLTKPSYWRLQMTGRTPRRKTVLHNTTARSYKAPAKGPSKTFSADDSSVLTDYTYIKVSLKFLHCSPSWRMSTYFVLWKLTNVSVILKLFE